MVIESVISSQIGLLVYKIKENIRVLMLVRTGTHSELF